MVCETCSHSMNTEARFCCHCGKPLMTPQTAQPWNAFAARLTRPREGRMMAGVCAGISEAYGLDPVLVRIATVILFFSGFGAIALVYLAAWIIMPNGPLVYAMPMTPQTGAGVPVA